METHRQGNKKVLYPFLDQIATVAPDKWWQDKFKDYSKGLLPKGVSLNGYIVTYSYMGDVVHYEISTEPSKAYNELRNFFIRHPKVATANTKRDSTETTTKLSTRPTPKRSNDVWNSIKSKHRRGALLGKFVEMIEDEYTLLSKQTNQLRDVIYTAQIEGVLDECIKLTNGLITSISCIEFDGEKFILTKHGPKGTRTIRVVPPQERLYSRYPPKQIDPDVIIENHMKALRKQRANTLIMSASTMLQDDESTT